MARCLVRPSRTPAESFDVIVEGDKQGNSNGLYKQLVGDSAFGGSTVQIQQQFNSIDGLQASLTGQQILSLAKRPYVTEIVANDAVAASWYGTPSYSNVQLWPSVIGAQSGWAAANLSTPTIAIVDSGIDSSRTGNFGYSRILAQVNLASLTPNSPGDGYGHGTFVAGIAASQYSGHAGVSPTSNLVSLDVMNDQGEATVADIVHACDWILANKSAYNIKVANFSLHAVNRASVLFDPLDQAVEKLWLNGVTVVTAAGNYATNGQASGVPYAPGNDPFVITVGAADTNNTLSTSDDFAAPWSAWGYTPDGFTKPDLSAPGRYIIGPVSAGTGLALSRPSNIVSSGWMELSGTSFSAPMVAGAAAELIAPASDVDARSAQGRADGLGQAHLGSARTARRRRTQHGASGDGHHPAQPQRRPRQVPDNQLLRTHHLQFASLAGGSPRQPRLGQRRLERRRRGRRQPGPRCLGLGSLERRRLGLGSLGSAAWSDAAWADAAWADAAWADNSFDDPIVDPTTTYATP